MNFRLIIIASLSSLAVETAFAAPAPRLQHDCMPGIGKPAPSDCPAKCYPGAWGTDYELNATHTQANTNVIKYQSKTNTYNSHRFTCSGIKQTVDILLLSYNGPGITDNGRRDGHRLFTIDEYFDISAWVKTNPNPGREELNYGKNEFVDYNLTLRAPTDVFKNDIREGWWNWDTYIKVHFPETHFILYHKKDFLGTRTINQTLFRTFFTPDMKGSYIFPKHLYDVVLRGTVTSAQTCTVDGGATIEFGEVSSSALRIANGEPPAGTPPKNGAINISCRQVYAPVKLVLRSSNGTINNALVGSRSDIGFKIVDENDKPIVPNGQSIAIDGRPTAWNPAYPKVKFKAWPVFFGSPNGPDPAPGKITGRATLDVQFQ